MTKFNIGDRVEADLTGVLMGEKISTGVVENIVDTYSHSTYIRVKWDNEEFERNYPEFAEDSILGNATKIISPALEDFNPETYNID